MPSEARDDGIGLQSPEIRQCLPAGEIVGDGDQVPPGQRLATTPEAEPKCNLREEVAEAEGTRVRGRR